MPLCIVKGSAELIDIHGPLYLAPSGDRKLVSQEHRVLNECLRMWSSGHGSWGARVAVVAGH